MRIVSLLSVIAGLALTPLAATAQAQASPCCGITKIDVATGVVTATVTANGQEFQFKVTDGQTLATAKVGQRIFANFGAKQVSLDGRRACCTITSGPSAAASAPPPTSRPTAAPSTAPTAAPSTAPTTAPSTAPTPRAETRAEARAAVPPTASATLPAVRALSFAGQQMTRDAAKGASAGSATGGQEVVLRVELTAPAPCVEHCGGTTVNGGRSGYMPVQVSGDNPGQFNVQRVLVRTGETVGEARFLTVPVSSPAPVVITVQNEGSAPRQATLTVLPPVMTSFVIDKTNVMGGEIIIATISFSGPPASANAVKVGFQTTNSQVLKVPASVTLAPNTTVATVNIVAMGVEQDRTAQVVATFQDKILPVSVAVRAAVLSEVDNARPCCDNPIVIKLDGRPPPQGAVIQLTSSNPARVVVPPTVTIPPDSNSITLRAQTIPGNSATETPITVSYRGVTKKWSIYSWPIVKPDLVVIGTTLIDRFGNAITAPPDGQQFRLCTTVRWNRDGQGAPNIPVPPSVLRIWYRSPTGTGTSTGRDVDFPIDFVVDVNQQALPITSCVDLSGLAPGGHYDVKLTADFLKQVDEDRENNNTQELKITRPPDE